MSVGRGQVQARSKESGSDSLRTSNAPWEWRKDLVEEITVSEITGDEPKNIIFYHVFCSYEKIMF